MDKLLDFWEKENKCKHGKHCHEQRKKYLFVISVYGMLGKEALVLLRNLSRLMATRLREPLSHIHGWVNVCTKIAIMRSYYHMTYVACLPSPLSDRYLDWE